MPAPSNKAMPPASRISRFDFGGGGAGRERLSTEGGGGVWITGAGGGGWRGRLNNVRGRGGDDGRGRLFALALSVIFFDDGGRVRLGHSPAGRDIDRGRIGAFGGFKCPDGRVCDLRRDNDGGLCAARS